MNISFEWNEMKYLLQSKVLPLDGTKCISNSWDCSEREGAESEQTCYSLPVLFKLMHQCESADGDWLFPDEDFLPQRTCAD